MATETIMIDGKQTKTLADRLRPGLRAIIAGINPSPISVLAGHYYQGQLGNRLWLRLVEHGILRDLPTPPSTKASASPTSFGSRRPVPQS